METLFLISGLIFAAIMIYLLPKYAKFIHTQPKLHQDQMRKQEEEKNKDKTEEK